MNVEVETITATFLVIEVVDIDCPHCHKPIITAVDMNNFVYCSTCRASSRLGAEVNILARHKAHQRIDVGKLSVFVRVDEGRVSVLTPTRKNVATMVAA